MIKLAIIIAFLLAITNNHYYQQEVSAQLAEQPQMNTTQPTTSSMVSPIVNYSLSQQGNSPVISNATEDSFCLAPEGQPINYFTVNCQNTLVNTTDQIDSLQCDKESGWVVVCVWRQQPFEENGISKIFAANSLTGGANWEAPPQLLSDNSSNAFEPRLGMSLENVYVAFIQDSGDGFDVYLVESNNGGVDWNLPAKNISNHPGNVTELTLTVTENGDVTVTWVISGTPGQNSSVVTRCARC